MLLIMIAADLMFGYLIGLLTLMYTDEDYAAWRQLKKITEVVTASKKRVSELIASVEMAKKHCTAGILRAQNIRAKRRVPYHQILTMLVLLGLLGTRASQAQTRVVQHHEGILIDTSGSISRGGTTNQPFGEYLISAKKLLLTEPANSRVWVSSISTDSFGGVHELMKGWTPDARGVFTDDLNRARRDLASGFTAKSSGMTPVSAGTDIFGGLWRMKTLFESGPKSDAAAERSKTIWIFSDMVNETQEMPMPTLIEMGSEHMLERAKAGGLLIPLSGYKIYVQGASTNGLKPQAWETIKKFWVLYFKAAGADLMTYSPDAGIER